jgi:hypothetical protein
MIRKEVAGHAHVSVSKVEVGSKESDEETNHLRIGVGKAKLVTRLRTLCPVEHATGEMEGIAHARKLTALFLSQATGIAPSMPK